MKIVIKKENGLTGKYRFGCDKESNLFLEVEKEEIIDSFLTEIKIWHKARFEDIKILEYEGE